MYTKCSLRSLSDLRALGIFFYSVLTIKRMNKGIIVVLVLLLLVGAVIAGIVITSKSKYTKGSVGAPLVDTSSCAVNYACMKSVTDGGCEGTPQCAGKTSSYKLPNVPGAPTLQRHGGPPITNCICSGHGTCLASASGEGANCKCNAGSNLDPDSDCSLCKDGLSWVGGASGRCVMSPAGHSGGPVNEYYVYIEFRNSSDDTWRKISNNNCLSGQTGDEQWVTLSYDCSNPSECTSTLYHLDDLTGNPMSGATTDNFIIGCSCASGAGGGAGGLYVGRSYDKDSPNYLEWKDTVWITTPTNAPKWGLTPVDPNSIHKNDKKIHYNIPYKMHQVAPFDNWMVTVDPNSQYAPVVENPTPPAQVRFLRVEDINPVEAGCS